jgi:hypothetical protein
VSGAALLKVGDAAGVRSVSGTLIDLSEGGCCVRVDGRVDPNGDARVLLDVDGTPTWLPVRLRWAQPGSSGWMVGCEFDHPTPATRERIRVRVEAKLGS